MYWRISFFVLAIIISNFMVMSIKHLTGEHLHKACTLSAELRSRGYPCQKVRQDLYLLLSKLMLGDLLSPNVHRGGLFKEQLKRVREIVKMVDLMSAPVYMCPGVSSNPSPSSPSQSRPSQSRPSSSGLQGLVVVWPKLKVEHLIELEVPVVTMADPKCNPGKSLRALSMSRGIDTALETLNQYLAEDMCDLIPKSFVLDIEQPQKWKTFIEDYENNSTILVSKKLEKLRGDGVISGCFFNAAGKGKGRKDKDKKGKDKKDEKDQEDQEDQKVRKEKDEKDQKLILDQNHQNNNPENQDQKESLLSMILSR
ncbi:uncharacterized protein LOC141849892 [Brevipalpus obovatus]|uniref:uncharacterized protein LOC141849892 n=1 Tax=Brevipalpus obovatus TaxID=246614 RepID=UPI003D9DE468